VSAHKLSIFSSLKLYKALSFVVILMFFFAQKSIAQKSNSGMTGAKWWIGVKGGMNFTKIKVVNEYSVLKNTSSGSADNSKEYDKALKNTGLDLALMLSYNFTQEISLSFQPGFAHYAFDYKNKYQWEDSTGFGTELNFVHHQKVNYLEFPLMIKYTKTFGRFTPYAQAGAFYGTLLNAKKIVDAKEFSINGGSNLEANVYQETFNLKDEIISSQLGLIGGAGIAVDVNYFRLALEFNYRYGFNNIVNVNNRYNDNRQTSGIYDVLDDMKIRNFGLCLNFSTPLDYLIHAPEGAAKIRKRR
jgi:hypothetical protein